MAAFATAHRHKSEKVSLEAPSILMPRSSVLPTITLSAADKATRSLASGFNRLSSIQDSSSIRQIVSLPTLSGSSLTLPVSSPFAIFNTQSLEAPAPRSRSVSRSSTPAPAPVPISIPTAEDLAKLEADKVKLDRAAANEELDRYMGAGLLAVADGVNLVHFWDVSSSASLSLCRMLTRTYR